MNWIFAFASPAFVLFSLVAITLGASPAPLTPLNEARGVVSRVESPPAIVERGANHRRWRSTVTETRADGRVITRPGGGFVELGSGLHRWDPQAGQWVDADPTIEAFQGFAMAGRAQCPVRFAPNANSAGCIQVWLPNGA